MIDVRMVYGTFARGVQNSRVIFVWRARAQMRTCVLCTIYIHIFISTPNDEGRQRPASWPCPSSRSSVLACNRMHGAFAINRFSISADRITTRTCQIDGIISFASEQHIAHQHPEQRALAALSNMAFACEQHNSGFHTDTRNPRICCCVPVCCVVLLSVPFLKRRRRRRSYTSDLCVVRADALAPPR